MKNIIGAIKQKLGRGELWAFSAAVAYSLSAVFTSLAIRGQVINYQLASSLRSLPVLLFSIFMVTVINKSDETRTSPFKDVRLILSLVAYGILTFFLGNTMFFSALQKGGVLITSPLVGTQILWAAVFAALLLRERLNWKMIAGMILSIVGVFILSLGKSGGIELAPRWWLAIPLALGTAICWSLSGVIMSYVQKRGVNRFQALLMALLVANITLHGYLLVTGQADVYSTTPLILMGKVVGAAMFNMLALIAITTAVGITTVASASTINSLQVGFAPLLAWAILAEQMNLVVGVGIFLILIGVIYVQLNREGLKGTSSAESS